MAPTVHGIIGDSFPKESLAKPLAMQGVGFQVGAAAGVAGAGAILAAGASGAFSNWPLLGAMEPWRVAFVLIGLPGLAALALIPLLHDPKEGLAKTQALPAEPILPFLRANKILVIQALLFAGLSAVGLGCMTAWVPEYLLRVHHVPPMQAGAMLGGYLLIAAIVGQGSYAVVADWLAGRGIKDAPVRLGLIPVALSVPLAWIAFGGAGNQAMILPLLLALAPCNAIANTTVQLIVPSPLRSRMAAASILVISIIGFTAGPALVGWISEYVVGEAYLGKALQFVVAGSMAASFLLMLLLRPRLKAHLEAA